MTLNESESVDVSDALLRQSVPVPVLSRRGAGPHPQEGRRQGDRVQQLRPQAGGAAVLSSVWDRLRQGNTATSTTSTGDNLSILFQYFCYECKLYDDEDKQQFHCDGCGICRVSLSQTILILTYKEV